MSERQRAIVTGFYESFNANDIDAAVGAASTKLETVDPGMGTVSGHGPFREYLVILKRAMPDARAEVETLVEAGDCVIVEGRFIGTHTGPLDGPDGVLEPTGASVNLRFADFVTVRAGQIVSYRTYYDQLGLLTQLGLTSPSAG